MHQLIAHHARTTPDAIALLAPGRPPLNYAALSGEIDRTAAALSALGIGRGDRIALVLPDGPELVVAFLATTTVAAAAPLNPGYRETEFDFYLSDLSAKALVVPAGCDSPVLSVARSRGTPVIELLVEPGAPAGAFTLSSSQSGPPPGHSSGGPDPCDIALYLHTSGTTSRPKLVPLSHANIRASALNTAGSLELSASDRCLNVMPLFHVHGLVGATLSSLAAGASVVCTPGFRAPQFFEWLNEFRPTWYTAVPTIHQAVVARAGREPAAVSEHSLRFLRSCSAALSPNGRADLENSFRIPVIEAYGMTEACHQMASTPLGAGMQKSGSVGLAAGPEVAVMDDDGVFVPSSARGEVVIRGANVTSGYQDNEAANEAAFTNGWFRTGDEGYLDNDGYLYITGRLKEIINRGGEKIAPREVDEVLAQHPAVGQAVAFGMLDARLGEDVAAAIVLRPGMQATERELRDYAAVRLADFKVPSRVVFVDAIPKGPTGKLQRIGLAKALGLVPTNPVSDPQSVPRRDDGPLTPLERALAAIFADVLRVPQVKRHDNFFDLGGDSLLAAQVLSHVRDVLNVDLKLIDLFDGKTVAALAEAVRTVRTRPIGGQPLTTLGEAASAPLSFCQQRLWFFSQWESDSPAYHHPVAVRLKGELDQVALHRGLDALLERHSVLRAGFPHEAGLPRQLIAATCTMPFEVVDHRELPDAVREAAAMTTLIERARQPFDIKKAPLVRSTLVRLSDADQILLISMHHLVSDGWSNRPLLRDLSAYYTAFRTGAPPALPPLSIQYQDFAAWQIERQKGDSFEGQLTYWRKQLMAPLPVLALPTDRPRPKVQGYGGARHSLRLSVDLGTRVEALSRREGVTKFMTLLAAFQALLANRAGQHDIVVGTPVAGRTHSETEQLVGSFVNTLAMRINLSGNPTFRELLARARTMALGAYAHQDVPFEKLVEVLRPERSLDRAPVFQVLFNFRNYPNAGGEFSDLQMEPVDLHLGVSQFDLTLEVEEVTDGLLCRLDYNTDLFDAETARLLLGDFSALLDSFATEPDLRILELPLPLAPVSGQAKICPTSDAQRGLWFLDRLEPGTATYNIARAFRLSGELDAAALDSSFRAIVSRHEVLRTTFESEGREPVQVVAPEGAFVLRQIDISALPPADREAEAQRLSAEEVARPFDLSVAPLMRALLLRQGASDCVVVLTIHHIICDGWSLKVLLQELGAFYEAFSTGAAVPLTPLPIQFADVVVAERGRLQGEAVERQLTYWRTRLSGSLPVLELPIDRGRTGALSSRGGDHVVAIPHFVMEDLKALGRTERATVFMTMFAVFQALLSRYGSQEQIIVGTPIGGRQRVELEPLIGLFLNTLVVRADFSGNPTFRELLRQMRATMVGAFENQDVPFERLVAELQPDRHPGVTPLVQAGFVFEEEAVAPKLRGLGAVHVPVSTRTAKFDLDLTVTDSPRGTKATLRYRTDLFDASTIERMGRHFETLLAGVIANPDKRISEQPLLTDAERQQLLVGWNQTSVPLRGRGCVHELFEEQAEGRPEAVAVAFRDQSLTYGELNTRSNQLAHYLQARGVGPEVLVGVCVERSLEMVIALLGILKAGGAYVPLDPADPDERLASILNSTGLPLILTVAASRERFAGNPASVVCLDTGWPEIEGGSHDNPIAGTVTDSLIYVMFTSGSTGTPKGVSVVHRGVVRLFADGFYARFGPDESVLQASALGFDVSTFDIWAALLHGARLILPEPKPTLRDLGRSLELHRVTTAWFTADLFHQMVDHELTSLRAVPQVLAGGDVLSVPHVRKFFAAPGSGALINGYGPTENTTFTSCHRMVDAAGIDETVSIGRPVANTQVYILDRNLNPLPVGVPGDLYAGGDGVARGYWKRPDLTAAAFIENPFAGAPGSRIYKTGDRARYRPDGRIEFLGRFDRQVKIRGFRVELEAIEAALAGHASVRDVVVVAREESPGGKRLVAYIAGRAAQPSNTEFRTHLARTLPSYMVPSAFVFVEALPLTPRGKVDLAALRALDGDRPGVASLFMAPRNAVEERIADVWRKVLRLEQVGVHDDFFDLGGHSLLAVQVMAHIEELFGRSLRLAVLFEAPTIAQLAERLAATGDDRHWSTIVPIEPAGSLGPFYCVHGAGGNVLGYSSLARHLRPNQPVYGIQAVGLHPERAPHTDIEAMATHYIGEIRTRQPRGPYHLGGLSFGGVVAFEMACQLRDQGHEVGLVALFDSFVPGHGRSLAWRVQLANYARRAGYHAGKLISAGRGDYLKKRIRTGRRRLRESVWRLRSARYRFSGRALPPLLRRVNDANWAAFRNYKPRQYAGHVTLFTATDRLMGLHLGQDLGWGQYARGGVEVHPVPGDHATFLSEPAVGILAEQLRDCLRKARESSTGVESPHGLHQT